ncbi:MAG: histidinol-phosphate transaminase [Candidatus Roizmanbacteria bacterium]|nr:histidinol-phosphate transaminase [Candidatus Roizmanbacteria bacterium]
MNKKIKIRKDLKNWQEYIPVQSAERISLDKKIEIDQIDKLDAGENVYGPSPRVQKKLFQFKGYQFYPDPEYCQLRKEISRYAKVKEQQVFVSNGADEIIDLILRLILNVGDEVIDCLPTFSSYSLSTILNRGVLKVIKRKKDFSIDEDMIIRAITKKTKVIFICNPNNPTGTITSIGNIQKILKKDVLVCIDEAYIEFGGESVVSLLDNYSNLVVIRSFSKWAGIAGLRLGYGLMDERLVGELMKIKPPYNVNYAAVIAGIAALQDSTYRKETVKTIINERNKMEKQITALDSYVVFPSSGNFIYVQTTKKQLENIKKECKRRNVSLRFYDLQNGGAIRITVGTPIQNRGIVNILKNIYEKII